MLAYSNVLNKYYNNDNVCYLTNATQVAKYLNNGALCDLVDIIYSGTKRSDTLVFVFNKTKLIKELYEKWNTHNLN